MRSAISVKDRLKNRAVTSGKTMQEVLTAYGLERTIYRLSVSEYMERFTLKGGIFLYALFDGEFARTTRDIDLLAKDIPNDIESMRKVFVDIFSIEYDDAIRYDLSTLEVKTITEFKEYHGVNISIMAYLDKTRIPVSIDVGFGDVVYPDRMKLKFPVLLDMDVPEVYSYPIYTAVSEKFEAIVSLGEANSRYKDFYDIYILADKYRFDGRILKEAVRKTFDHRETKFEDIRFLEGGVLQSELHQHRWNAFLKKKGAMVNVDFGEVMERIKSVFEPVIESVDKKTEYDCVWDVEEKRWKD